MWVSTLDSFRCLRHRRRLALAEQWALESNIFENLSTLHFHEANDMGDSIANPNEIHVKLLFSCDVFSLSCSPPLSLRGRTKCVLHLMPKRRLSLCSFGQDNAEPETPLWWWWWWCALFKHFALCACSSVCVCVCAGSGFCEINRPDTQQIIVNNVNLCVCITYYVL